MRADGIVRRIDDLGRIVIPREIRRRYGIKEGDPIEIFANKDEIILTKYDVSVGLKELVGRLDNEFFDVKSDIETETANKIYEHINALQDILKSINTD